MTKCQMIDAIKKNYPPESYSMLREALDHCIGLLEAEAEDRLLVLPCRIGEDIYTVVTTDRRRGSRPCKHPVRHVRFGQLSWNNLRTVVAEFGKTVFLTREEAAAALRKEQEKETMYKEALMLLRENGMICPRCKSREVEEHQEAGDLPWWECLDCGLCWDGSEAGA